MTQWTRTYSSGHLAHIVSKDQKIFQFVVYPPERSLNGSLKVDAAETLHDAKTKADAAAGQSADESAWTGPKAG